MTNEISFKTRDGLKLQGRQWPVDDPIGLVCFVHGYGEHCGRYGHVAQLFNAYQLGFFAFDHRGHGRSEGKRGDAPSFDSLVDDVDSFVTLISRKHPGFPVCIYGHSMGGTIVARYILNKKVSHLKAAIVSSPWIKLAFEPSRHKIWLGKIMLKIYPGYREKSDMDINALSSDKSVCEMYLDDPLIHDRMSARLFFGIRKAGLWIADHGHWNRLPLLLVHGEGDRITSHLATSKFAETCAGDVVLKIWPALLHETHNESNKEEVIQYNIKWLIQQLRSQKQL